MKCPQCSVETTKVGAFLICPTHGQLPEIKPFVPLRIFLSYGHDYNEDLVRRIKADLEERGHDVWFDKNEIKFGDEWRRSITDGIVDSHRVLSFLSKHSTRDPGVCRDEIAIAIGVKGGNIQTILVESEQEVQPPVNIGHIQWLDMHDWKEQRATGEAAWEPWYQAKLAEIVRVVESDESRRLAGEIETLNGHLKPIKSEARINQLLSKGFCGRQWLFEAVEKWRTTSKDGPSGPDSRLFWIMGAPGVGKSAFAAQLTHTRGDTVLAAQFCEWDKPDHRNALRVVRSLAFQLATRLPDYRKLLLILPEIDEKNLDRKDAAELFDYLLANPLRSVINGGRERKLIVIDALDEAGEAGRNPLVEMLARNANRLPNWLCLVVTSRPEFDVRTPFQALNPIPLDTQSESNRADIRDYLRRALESHLPPRPEADRLVEQILEKSEGVFLYVERFCDDVQKGHLSLDRPEQFPQGLGEGYLQDFQRQFPDEEKFKNEIRPLLRVILVAREPLPVETLKRLFKWQDEQLQDVIRTLGSLFPVINKRIKPHHKFLSDWLTDDKKAVSYYVSIAEGHGLLSDKGLTLWPHDNYLLAHLLAHLFDCQRLNDALTLLTEAPYLEARIEAGQVSELADDIAAVFKQLPEGDSRRRLLTLLETQARSKKTAMARMTIQCLAAITEYDPAGVGKVVITMVERPTRIPHLAAAQDNMQAVRVALEISLRTCRLDSMKEAVQQVLLSACATADKNVRWQAIVAIYHVAGITPPFGLRILQELARRSVWFGLIRPRRLEAFASCALALYLERPHDESLIRDLRPLVKDLISRVWGKNIALWLMPKVVGVLWASVPGDYNGFNLMEIKGFKKHAAADPELTAALNEMINCIDPNYGTSEQFSQALRRLVEKPNLPVLDCALGSAMTASVSRALTGDASALEAFYESWKRLAPGHEAWGGFMDWMRIAQVGLQRTDQTPLAPIWTLRMEAILRDAMCKHHGGMHRLIHTYWLGGMMSGIVFVAHQLGHGRLQILAELIEWAVAGEAGMRRWPDTPKRDHQPDALLSRLLEVVGVEYGLFDRLSRETVFHGISSFLGHASKFDEFLWNSLATILVRMRFGTAHEVDDFLATIQSDHREELHVRMNRILPENGAGSLLSVHHHALFYASVLAEPAQEENGLRRELQEFIRVFFGPQSMSASLRHAIPRLLRLVQHGSCDPADNGKGGKLKR